jgi:hypothetical protein
MKIKVCHCKQCRGVKKRKSTKLKRRIKRYTNKLRRRDLEDTEIYNWYWA